MDLNNQQLLVEVQNNNIGAAEDRISELPDPLLHHILFYLGTSRDAARTCVLSKRWNHIWTSIPTLNFNFWDSCDSTSEEINKFMDFVETTLRLHDTATTIESFILFSNINLNASRVDSWIKDVTTRTVQKLTLVLVPEKHSPFHFQLFTCESLTKLVLNVGRLIYVPKNISFPNLKSLKLFGMKFMDSCRHEQLFSNSHVLEELIFENCTWSHMSEFCILAPALKVLQIYNYRISDDNGLQDCDLKIHAPSLVSLKYLGSIAKDYDLSSFLALDKAEVDIFEYHGATVSKLLQSLSHVRCLSVRTYKVPVAYDFLSSLPTFHNLNELTVLRGQVKDNLIFALLKAAPNLKRLLFNKYSPLCVYPTWCDLSSIDDETEYVETEDVFGHLQSVEFRRFSGEARELRWAELIMKNAESLQTMTISHYSFFLVKGPILLIAKTQKENKE